MARVKICRVPMQKVIDSPQDYRLSPEQEAFVQDARRFLAAEAPTQAAADKLARLIRGASVLKRGEQEALEAARSAERSRRVGAAASTAEKLAAEGMPYEQALARSTSELRGELPRLRFEAPDFSPDDLKALWGRMERSNMQYLDKVSAREGLLHMLSGAVPEPRQLELLRRLYGDPLVTAVLSRRSLGIKAFEEIMGVIGLPRTIITSFDLSAPLRQGMLLIGHPKEFFGSLPKMVKSFASERIAQEVDDAIKTGAGAARRKEAGLFIGDYSTTASIGMREEAYSTRWARYIPGLRQSERAYVTYLNKLRADIFDNIVAGWDRLGGKTLADEKALAEMLNVFSGRGNLKAVGAQTQMLGQVLFSARLLASRVQAPLQLFSSSGAVRMIAARDLAAFLATGVGILSLAKLAGADVELDPRSTDVGKIRVGPQRLDFWAGYQPLVRYFAQVTSGQRKGPLGEIKDIDRTNALMRFFDSKLSPQASLAQDLLTGETFLGEKMKGDQATVKRETYNRLVPLFLQDLRDAIEEQGWRGGVMASPGAFGASSQTYTSKEVQIANQIADDITTGKLQDIGERIPLRVSELSNRDEQAFRSLHPDLEYEPDVSTPKGAAYEASRHSSERLHTDISKLASDYRSGDLGGEEFRKAVDDLIIGNQGERQVIGDLLRAQGVEAKPPPEGSAQVLTDLYQYGRVFEAHPNTRTAEEKDALFAAIDAFRTRLGPRRERDMDANLGLSLRDIPEYQRLKAAKRLASEAYDIQKYRGISEAQDDAIRQFDDDVETWREQKLLERGGRNKPSVAAGRAAVAREQRIPRAIVRLAIQMSKPAIRQRRLNPEYVAFLVEHYDELDPFYHGSLYPDYILERVGRSRR